MYAMWCALIGRRPPGSNHHSNADLPIMTYSPWRHEPTFAVADRAPATIAGDGHHGETDSCGEQAAGHIPAMRAGQPDRPAANCGGGRAVIREELCVGVDRGL